MRAQKREKESWLSGKIATGALIKHQLQNVATYNLDIIIQYMSGCDWKMTKSRWLIDADRWFFRSNYVTCSKFSERSHNNKEVARKLRAENNNHKRHFFLAKVEIPQEVDGSLFYGVNCGHWMEPPREWMRGVDWKEKIQLILLDASLKPTVWFWWWIISPAIKTRCVFIVLC